MTERGRSQVARDACTLRIGPSQMQWRGDSLHIDLDEITVPWPTRVRGRVTVHAPGRSAHEVELVPGQCWCPIAPRVRVEVDLGGQRWQGPGYLDANRGDAPLEQVFRRWDWSRAHLPDGSSVVLYDLEPLQGAPRQVALRFGRDGSVEAIEPPPPAPLPPSLWRVARGARSDAGTTATVLRTLTDAPFYARSLIDAHWLGTRVTAMHESLSLARFARPWVQAMLPFRMPRVGGL